MFEIMCGIFVLFIYICISVGDYTDGYGVGYRCYIFVPDILARTWISIGLCCCRYCAINGCEYLGHRTSVTPSYVIDVPVPIRQSEQTCIWVLEYFLCLFLRCCYWILELFQQCGIFVSSFYDVVIGYWSCSNSVVFLFSLSTIFLLDIGAVPTVCYFCFLFLRYCY
jgi:hypothetical protein